MPATVYRVPDTELFLRADGSFTAMVDPDSEVRDLTPADSDVLQVIHHGYLLQRLAATRGSGGENPFGEQDHAIDLGIRAVKMVPYGSGYIEFVSILNEMVGGPHGKPDPILESLNRVHQKLAEIQDFNLAAWKTQREESLADLTAMSFTALYTANAFIQSKGERTDPVWAAKIAIADRDSMVAVRNFSADVEKGYWTRPYSLPAISQSGDPTSYTTGWMPHLPDRVEKSAYNEVWDYRWALPALKYAIVARLLVVTAFSTGTRFEYDQRCAEVASYVKVLQSVFSKRWQGLRTLDRLTEQQQSWCSTTGRFPMAAVDLYGGTYFGGAYFISDLRPTRFPPGMAAPNMDPYTSPSGPKDLAWVDRNVKAFATHWWNLLYLQTGLEDLLLFISALQGICDKPWFSTMLTDVHTSVVRVTEDDSKRRIAQLAASLSAVTATEDHAEAAGRTHHLFEALSGGGDRAQGIVDAAVSDLMRLARDEDEKG